MLNSAGTVAVLAQCRHEVLQALLPWLSEMSLEHDVDESGGSLPGHSVAASYLHTTAHGSRRPGTSPWGDMRVGPQNAAEAFQCIESALIMLQANAPLINVEQPEKTLLEALSNGIELSTDFSGMGGGEEAMRRIVAGARKVYGHELPESSFTCVRAGDIAEHCRSVLRSHEGPSRPQCVFGDVLERMSGRAKRRILHVMNCTKGKLWTRLAAHNGEGQAAKDVKRKMMKDSGKAFMMAASRVVYQNRETALMHAHCYIHDKQCPVCKPQNENFHGLRVLIIGIHCYDWSSRGSQEGWLGGSSMSYFQVIFEVRTQRHDIFILECTLQFDEAGLEQLADDYCVTTLVFRRWCWGSHARACAST